MESQAQMSDLDSRMIPLVVIAFGLSQRTHGSTPRIQETYGKGIEFEGDQGVWGLQGRLPKFVPSQDEYFRMPGERAFGAYNGQTVTSVS